MVALTGSLALLNSEASADLDYMLVATQGRVWIERELCGDLAVRQAPHTVGPEDLRQDQRLLY